MRIRISENPFFLGLIIFLIGAFILFNTVLVGSPVKISERGLLFDVAAIVLLYVSVQLIRKSVHKQ